MTTNTQGSNQSLSDNSATFPKTEERVSLTDDTLGIIGTSLKGPAFVPHTCVRYEKSNEILNTFGNVFGTYRETEKPDISPLTAGEWFNQGGEQLTFTRVLGVGKTGIPNADGIVEGSGFVVGGNVVSGSAEAGFAGANSFATTGGDEGKTYFIGATFRNNNFISNDNSKRLCTFNDYLEQIGENSNDTTAKLVTDVIFSPSGSKLLISNEVININNMTQITNALPNRVRNDYDNNLIESGDINIERPFFFF